LEKLKRRHFERGNGPNNHQRSVHAETTDDRLHRLAACDRCEDDLGAAELLKLRRWVLCLTVDVLRRSKLPGERFLVFPPRDGNRFETALRGELNTKMAKSAEAEYGDDFAGPRTTIAKTIERGDSSADNSSGTNASADAGASIWSS
jgi:hypothetical protein